MARLTLHEITMAELDEDYFETYEKFHNNKIVKSQSTEPEQATEPETPE